MKRMTNDETLSVGLVISLYALRIHGGANRSRLTRMTGCRGLGYVYLQADNTKDDDDNMAGKDVGDTQRKA